MNRRDNKKIVNFILNYPIEEEQDLSYFIPLLKENFNYSDDVLDNLTDGNNLYTQELWEMLLKPQNNLNSAAEKDFINIAIKPTKKSINLAKNNSPKFEQYCIQKIEAMPSDKEKGMYFEKIVQHLLKIIGIETTTTQGSGDNGIDLYGSSNIIGPLEIRGFYFIQCKYYSNSPDINLVKKIAADILFNLFEKSSEIKHPIIPVLICKESPSKSAREFAETQGITYITLKEIIEKISEKTELDPSILDNIK